MNEAYYRWKDVNTPFEIRKKGKRKTVPRFYIESHISAINKMNYQMTKEKIHLYIKENYEKLKNETTIIRYYPKNKKFWILGVGHASSEFILAFHLNNLPFEVIDRDKNELITNKCLKLVIRNLLMESFIPSKKVLTKIINLLAKEKENEKTRV